MCGSSNLLGQKYFPGLSVGRPDEGSDCEVEGAELVADVGSTEVEVVAVEEMVADEGTVEG
uniref:Uncharacterized protein n=1 Tax=Romanomermis culicivorax TaxID=13658 RepID=A0A915IJF8_ROMCU